MTQVITEPTTSSSATAANTHQDSTVPVMTAQTSTASPIRIDPGSTGIAIPTRPTRIASPTSSVSTASLSVVESPTQSLPTSSNPDTP